MASNRMYIGRHKSESKLNITLRKKVRVIIYNIRLAPSKQMVMTTYFTPGSLLGFQNGGF